MKALSVKQPWAWLIVNGVKDIENHDWKTNFRGRILIHASKTPINDSSISIVKSIMERVDKPIQMPTIEELKNLSGSIVGSVEIVDCVKKSVSPWFPQVWFFTKER